jgi:hypothetical protein
METTLIPINTPVRLEQIKMTSKGTIRIEIRKNGATNTIERDGVDATTSIEDLMNLLFISGTDIHELEESLITISQEIKNKHKNEHQANKNPSTMGL